MLFGCTKEAFVNIGLDLLLFDRPGLLPRLLLSSSLEFCALLCPFEVPTCCAARWKLCRLGLSG